MTNFSLYFTPANHKNIRPVPENLSIYAYQTGYDLSRYSAYTLAGWSGSSLGDLCDHDSYRSYFTKFDLVIASNPESPGSQGINYYIMTEYS
jgi:hypothetical protein